MIINISKPSPLEAELLPVAFDNSVVGMSMRPLQYQRSQRTLYVTPVLVCDDSNNILDRAFLTVNSKTGKLSLEHRNAPIACLVDAEGKAPVKGAVSEAKQTATKPAAKPGPATV